MTDNYSYFSSIGVVVLACLVFASGIKIHELDDRVMFLEEQMNNVPKKVCTQKEIYSGLAERGNDGSIDFPELNSSIPPEAEIEILCPEEAEVRKECFGCNEYLALQSYPCTMRIVVEECVIE